jgi:hypothetical protein
MKLKNLFSLALLALLAPTFLHSQGLNAPISSDRYIASDYGQWQGKVASGPNTTGSVTYTMTVSNIAAKNGRSIVPFATNAPILIGTSNAEVQTPSAVSCPPNTSAGGTVTCTVTVTVTNAHGAGELIQSGSGGLQEAENDCSQSLGGIVTLNRLWASFVSGLSGVTNGPANAQAVITAAQLSGPATAGGAIPSGVAGVPNVCVIEDDSGASGPIEQIYKSLPTGTGLIAAPSAPTVSAISGGSMSSGAYKATAAYVDCGGGISADSSESSATATTTAVQVNSPAAATGACAWLPRISTAGGSGNEILAKSPLDSTVCQQSVLVKTIYACAIGSNATITANPSNTAKPNVQPNAFANWAPQAVGWSQANIPVVTSYPFGVFVATATLNNSNADGAVIGPFPAGFFNRFGGKWKVCPKVGTATQVASSLLTVNVTMANEYAQSPVTVSTNAFPTQTQAAAGTAQGCTIIQTSTTGSSGKIWASNEAPWVNFLNSAPSTQVVTADASAGQSSTINLTKQIYLAVNLQAANANNITVPIVNGLTFEVVQ